MVVPNRELTEEEVLSIFEHVHHNRSLPPDLKYQVIPVDPNGSKISPPRFNFSDGLFVLCDTNNPNLPKHLLQHVCRELPPKSPFHWHPAKKDKSATARVQMRNCYRYKTGDGGNLGGPKAYIWTKLINNGNKEDLQYRLIHVLSGKFTAPMQSATNKEYTPKRLETTASANTAVPVAPPPPPPPRRTSVKKPPPPPPAPKRLVPTIRRKTTTAKPTSTKTPTACLTEEQVKAVFDSVYNNTKPPPNLTYQVISVEPSSGPKARISPPRLKYNDGIYILCDTTDSSLPSHLAALVGTQPPTKERLRWNVSGMATSRTSQYSRRHVSAMNERHERFADYNKNATMWSQLVKGKENMKCRIFHVFPRDGAIVKKEVKTTNASRVASSRIASRKPTVYHSKEENGCQVCGMQDNSDSLMECDGCASRYCHTFCLGLTALPEGEWLCKMCMPRKPHKKRSAGNGVHGATGPKKSRSLASRAVSPVPMDNMVEEETTKAIHYKIMSRQKASGDADNHIGFLAVDSQQMDATFTDIRAMIHEELDPESLPKGNWKFVVPTLGPIGQRQEKTIGPVATLYKRAFEGRLGDGSGWNPFELSLMTSPSSPMDSC